MKTEFKILLVFCVWLFGFQPAGFCQAGVDGDKEFVKKLKPLWEFGLFAGAARLPDYRGSDEHKTYVLPR